MKVYLTKQNRKTTDFVLMEADGHLVFRSSGKIGKSGISRITGKAGTPEKAIAEINDRIAELTAQGYKISDIPRDLVTEDIVFDKAKWHVNEQFPKDLDQYQSYIHTGFFVCWLLESNFYESDFRTEYDEPIQKLLKRKVNPSKFYKEQLDGVFDAEGLTQEAIKFTEHYFDFEKGQYIVDYFAILDPDEELPSMFHVDDSWDNYDKLKPKLNERLAEWRQK